MRETEEEGRGREEGKRESEVQNEGQCFKQNLSDLNTFKLTIVTSVHHLLGYIQAHVVSSTLPHTDMMLPVSQTSSPRDAGDVQQWRS